MEKQEKVIELNKSIQNRLGIYYNQIVSLQNRINDDIQLILDLNNINELKDPEYWLSPDFTRIVITFSKEEEEKEKEDEKIQQKESK